MTATTSTTTSSSPADRLRALAGDQLARDGWSRDRLLELQGERLRALVAHAVAASPYYREVLGPDAASGDVPLRELPTLPSSYVPPMGWRLSSLKAWVALRRFARWPTHSAAARIGQPAFSPISARGRWSLSIAPRWSACSPTTSWMPSSPSRFRYGNCSSAWMPLTVAFWSIDSGSPMASPNRSLTPRGYFRYQ